MHSKSLTSDIYLPRDYVLKKSKLWDAEKDGVPKNTNLIKTHDKLIQGRDKKLVMPTRAIIPKWSYFPCSIQGDIIKPTTWGGGDHSFHMSANSSGSNGLDSSCIFLLVLALTFLANFPAFCFFSSARICEIEMNIMPLMPKH